jgi:hypothetical protein
LNAPQAAKWFIKRRKEKEERVRKQNLELRAMYPESVLQTRRAAAAVVEAQKAQRLQEVREAAGRQWTVPLERALVVYMEARSAAELKELDDLVDALQAQQLRTEAAGASSCPLSV